MFGTVMAVMRPVTRAPLTYSFALVPAGSPSRVIPNLNVAHFFVPSGGEA
jgi:hypothetical protein